MQHVLQYVSLPSPAERVPSGPGWVYEIKHDGFRMMVRRDASGVRLLTRRGNDWTQRYPLIAHAIAEWQRHYGHFYRLVGAGGIVSPEQAQL